MSPIPRERLEKILARVAREQGLDQERLRRWVSFLAMCGVLERAIQSGILGRYFLKGGVAMELRLPTQPAPPRISTWGLTVTGPTACRALPTLFNSGSMNSPSVCVPVLCIWN